MTFKYDEISNLTADQESKLKSGEELPIMEEFYTIQGEGFNTGKPAYFIRVGGCDVGCHWCDVKESWNPNLHPLRSVDDVVDNSTNFPANDIVITGGEPAIYNLSYLCRQLKESGKNTFLETCGAYEISGEWDWICLSPKKSNPPIDSSYQKAHELKVIIYNKSDFDWAEEHAKKVGDTCKLYLQPEWSKSSEMTQKITEYVMNHPKWNISLQTHKFIGIP